MKKRSLTGSKTYWVAQSRDNVADAFAFRTREGAVHFIDHRVEGWATGNAGHGWALFQCAAWAQWQPAETLTKGSA